MLRKASAAFFSMLMLIGVRAFAADLKFPPLTGRVVDNAGILTNTAIDTLDQMLAQHERTTTQQVVVVTLDSLQGHAIEDYGYQLGRAWGIGQKGRNNGALLIVAPHERKVRIEVGYGLEGQLTDAISRVIIENNILPRFRVGDYSGGVLDGTTAIMRTLGDDASANLNKEPEQVPPASDVDQTQLPPAAELALLIFFLVVIVVVMRRGGMPYVIRNGLYRGPYHSLGNFRGGGGFGGGGGGGFSGGGGSFGGGGASGGW
jgi:uncharacterized protein